MPLIGRADRHPAIERQLEGSEFEPGIARVRGVRRGCDLPLQNLHGILTVQAPGQYRANRQAARGLQFLVHRDLAGIHGAVAYRGQPGRNIALQLLLQGVHPFGFGKAFRPVQSFDQRLCVLQHPVRLAIGVLHDLAAGRVWRVAIDAAQFQRVRIQDHDITGIEEHRVILFGVQHVARGHAHFLEPGGKCARHYDPLALGRFRRLLAKVLLHGRVGIKRRDGGSKFAQAGFQGMHMGIHQARQNGAATQVDYFGLAAAFGFEYGGI